VVGKHAERILSGVEAAIIQQTQLTAREVNETPIAMGGIHVDVPNDEMNDLGKQMISLQIGTTYAVPLQTKEMIKVQSYPGF